MNTVKLLNGHTTALIVNNEDFRLSDIFVVDVTDIYNLLSYSLSDKYEYILDSPGFRTIMEYVIFLEPNRYNTDDADKDPVDTLELIMQFVTNRIAVDIGLELDTDAVIEIANHIHTLVTELWEDSYGYITNELEAYSIIKWMTNEEVVVIGGSKYE